MVEKKVPCMPPVPTSLPDDTTWTYATDGSASLPVDEVLAVFLLIDYMGKSIAACHAATTPTP